MVTRSTQWHKQLEKKVLNDPEMRFEYETYKGQLELAEKMKKARIKAHLTQENVAEKMETQKTVIARLEAAGGKGRHSPSFSTLSKYAAAIGCKLEIKLVPKRKQHHHHTD